MQCPRCGLVNPPGIRACQRCGLPAPDPAGPAGSLVPPQPTGRPQPSPPPHPTPTDPAPAPRSQPPATPPPQAPASQPAAPPEPALRTATSPAPQPVPPQPTPPPQELWGPPVTGPTRPVSGSRPSAPGARRSGPRDHRRPVRIEALIGVTVWRLLIVVFALIGLFSAVDDLGIGWGALKALSQSASLLAAVVYGALLLYPVVTGFEWHEPRSAWWRGATTVTLLLVAGVFLTMLGGNLGSTASLFEHLLTPLIVFVDWCVVGRNQANTRPWTPLTWLCFPALYLVYYNLADLELYESSFTLRFDNPDFWSYFAGFAVGLIATGYLLFLIGRLKAWVADQQEAMKRESPTYSA